MHSLRTRFIIVFGLFILLSCSIMGVFSAFSIIQTGVALCSEQGVPIAQKADEIIDGDKFEALCNNLSVNDPYYEEARKALQQQEEQTFNEGEAEKILNLKTNPCANKKDD